ncbi:MAG: methylated-DNA--[protein]-cysteine S-methyltransferase [Rhizobiaceae bacterium]|nr:methylated-DNA--[protein]-cysteine S-methyltransferase [Rhizobiaceae bacterium]
MAQQSPAAAMAVDSPFGPLSVCEADGAIVAIDWRAPERSRETATLRRAAEQLAAYFAKELQEFDLPLRPKGDEFQQSVCQAMLAIPYGATTTYGEIAAKLDTYGQPVGNACGANSIPIIIPCHRVLAANGLGGYSGEGGVERKIELLKLEDGFPYLL